MGTTSIELPSDLLKVAGQFSHGDLAAGTARLLALELFREHKVSLGRAAELCETPLAAFMAFAAQHGVAPIRYGERELDEDRQALLQLGL